MLHGSVGRRSSYIIIVLADRGLCDVRCVYAPIIVETNGRRENSLAEEREVREENLSVRSESEETISR